MTDVKQLITEHLDIWLTAETEKKSGRGRSSGAKDTIYGVQKLRELILDLAIRGKLVAQNANGEPASELLKKISMEKEKLVKEGKIKKAKPLPVLDETPFTIPSNWVWSYLQDLSSYIQRGKSPKYTENSNRIVVSQKCVRWQGLDLSPARFIEPESLDNYEEIRFLQQDDVLWNSTGTGTIGRACLFEINENFEKVVADSHVTVVRLLNDIAKFIYLVIRSPYIQKDLEDSASGTTNQIELNTSTVQQTKIPLPPLEEQQRIVEKVDELMQLCDQLEQQQTLSSDAHATLVDTLLKALTEANDADEFQANWQRIVANFDLLFTTEYSIDQLKQTVLQLAVMGKLVNSERMDELTRLQIKQHKVNFSKKNSETKFISFVGLEELKNSFSKNMEIFRLGDIADIVRGGSPRPAGDLRFYEGSIPFLKVADITRSKGKFVEGHTSTIKEAGLHKTRYIDSRTVLLTNSGATLGVPAICDFPTTFNDGVAAFINLSEHVFDEYLYLYLSTLTKWFLDVAAQGQGQPNLNTDIVKSTWIALPPFNVQKNIVHKVDQLFSLIEQLQVLQSKLQKTKLHLADALVANAAD